jgi:hypothetical protein
MKTTKETGLGRGRRGERRGGRPREADKAEESRRGAPQFQFPGTTMVLALPESQGTTTTKSLSMGAWLRPTYPVTLL